MGFNDRQYKWVPKEPELCKGGCGFLLVSARAVLPVGQAVHYGKGFCRLCYAKDKYENKGGREYHQARRARLKAEAEVAKSKTV